MSFPKSAESVLYNGKKQLRLIQDNQRSITLAGETFSELMNLCFKHADYFTLTKSLRYKNVSYYISLMKSTGTYLRERKVEKELKHALRPFCVKRIRTLHWFCYYSEAPLEVTVYKAVAEAKAVLFKFFDDLFLEQKQPKLTPRTHEDLCFFQNGRLILGTVSHEYICHAYPQNEEFDMRLRTLGPWEEEAYCGEEHLVMMSVK